MDDPEVPRPSGRLAAGIAVVLALTVAGYVVYVAWRGWHATRAELAGFRWLLLVPVVSLTLVNYGLRFVKWAWLLRRVGVGVPLGANVVVFLVGLGMVVSPGKAGELIKPWAVGRIAGAPLSRTLPVLVAERLTDAVAVALLAALGVSTFWPEDTWIVLGTLGALGAGIAAVSNEALGRAVLIAVAHVPVLGRAVPRLQEAWDALRACLGPLPLLVTLAISVAAWFAQCLGYQLVLEGFGVTCELDRATFLYTSATLLGAPSPGGVGLADVALAEGAARLVPGLSAPRALAAALVTRVATLWVGVLAGAIAMLGLERAVTSPRGGVGARV